MSANLFDDLDADDGALPRLHQRLERDADAADLLGVAYRTLDTPVGPLLLAATEDRLHQAYREPAMPETLRLVRALRADGIPAVVSGAGPTVLAFADASTHAALEARVPNGWQVMAPPIDLRGACVTVDD